MTLADLLTDGEHWNPYDFANPVNDDLLFAGREKELRDIKYYLQFAARAPRPINLVVTGPRSAGKTSLLNRIELEATERNFCVSRVNLNEGDVDPFALFYKIYDAILVAAIRDGAFAGLTGPTYMQYRDTMDGGTVGEGPAELLFPRHYITASSAGRALSEPTFIHDLEVIRDTLGKPSVILFDECDVLGQSRIELEMLRNVFMNTKGFMLVFSGTPQLFPVMEDVFSPIVRQFKKIPVENFDDVADTLDCIVKPLQLVGLPPADVLLPSPTGIANQVHQLSGGRPYEIQLLCHYMFKRVEAGDARNMTISLDLLDDVRLELEKQGSGTDRPSLAALQRLSPSKLRILAALTRFQGTVPQLAMYSQIFSDNPYTQEELAQALASLNRTGLLSEGNDQVVRFVGDQFDEIYATYYAAANDVSLHVAKIPFRIQLTIGLEVALRQLDVGTLLFLGVSPSEIPSTRVPDALEDLLSPPDSTTATLPEAAAALYPPVLEAHYDGVLRLASVHLSLPDVTVEEWIVLHADEDEFLAEPGLVKLQQRIDACGGTLEARIYPEHQLDERDQFVHRVRQVASPNQLEEFALAHHVLAFNLYRKGDFTNALSEFLEAHSLAPEAAYANSCAHTSLVLGRHSSALEHANKARDMTRGSTSPNDLEQYLIGSYDAAIALLLLDQRDEAFTVLKEVKENSDRIADPSGYYVRLERLENDTIVVLGESVDEMGDLRHAVAETMTLMATLESPH